MNKSDFLYWFDDNVKVRWPRHHFAWTEVGDWAWRLEEFDSDILTQAVRKHKTREDYRAPSLKKVHEYVTEIQSRNSPKRQHRNNSVPDAHTYIMCVAKDDNGRGCVGWFVPILLWPFKQEWKPEDYTIVAEQQLAIHSRRGGKWKIFTNTTHGKMLIQSNKLRGIKPLDLNALRKRKRI